MVIERITPPNAIGQRVRAGSYTGTVIAIDGNMYTVDLDRLHTVQAFERNDLTLIGGAA
jgi:hypothetical protein